MPDIRPFRGVRYDMAQVGALSDVVAPPYDVIDPALQDRLYAGQPLQHHPAGAEPRGAGRRRRGEPLHPRRPVLEGLAPRRRAPRGRPPPRSTSTTRPSRSRASLHPQGVPGAGPARAVRPGEDLPARADPLGPQGRPARALSTRPDSTSARSSASIPTPTARSSAPSRRACATGRRWRRPTTSASRTGSGRSTTPRRTPPVQGLMAAKPIFIADGHHRYETGLKYRDERAAGRRPYRPRRPGQLLHDDARRHERPRALDPADPPAGLRLPRPDRRSPHRAARARVRGPDRPAKARPAAAPPGRTIEIGGDQDMLGFGTVADGRWLTARLRSDAPWTGSPPSTAPSGGASASASSMSWCSKRCSARWATASCRYVHLLDEVLDRRRRTAAATSPASSPRPAWSTSSRSPRTSKRCRPRAPISIPSCSAGWCSTRFTNWKVSDPP